MDSPGSNCRQYGLPRALSRLRAVLVSSVVSSTLRAISHPAPLANGLRVQQKANKWRYALLNGQGR